MEATPYDLSISFFRDEQFLQRNGRLNTDSALLYFMSSPFYDSTTGNEYVVLSPPSGDQITLENLYFIEKRADGVAVAIFYILFGNIYMCPSVHDVLSAKLERTASHLGQLLSKLTSS
jgi:MED6 mediator sub complex component